MLGANVAFAFALLFWRKYKIKPLEFLLGLRPRTGMALHYATDSLRRGEPLFKKGQKLRVLRPIEATMIVVPKFTASVTIRVPPGEVLTCVGRTPASHIELSYSGDIRAYIERTVAPAERQLALNEVGGGSTMQFYLPKHEYFKLEECFAVAE